VAAPKLLTGLAFQEEDKGACGASPGRSREKVPESALRFFGPE